MENIEKSIVDEVSALKSQFDKLKAETEDFVANAKHLSERGADEAKELLQFAKENWGNLVSVFESSKISKLFSNGKKTVKKAAKKTSKKMTKKPAAKKKSKKSKSRS